MSFTGAEVLGFLAFYLDFALALPSALVLVGGLLFGNSGRGWAIVLGATAGLNLLLSSILLLTVADGLDSVVWLVAAQAVVSAAVLVIVTRRPWRAIVFGRRRANS